MRKLVAAAAVIALTATMAQAEPNKGNGNGNKGGAEKAQKANGNGNGNGGNKAQGNGHANSKAQQRKSGSAKQAEKAQANFNGQKAVNAAKPANYKSNGAGKDNARRDVVRIGNGNDRGEVRYGGSFSQLVDGCPPGLAKKRNGCTPPGLAKQGNDGRGYYRPDYFGFSSFGDGRYLYNDGYLLRLGNNGGVSGYIPLLGGALTLGNPWPTSYRSYPASDYYVDYYNLGSRNDYRYADNVIYRVDPESAAISSIVALLTGDDFSVGQRVPSGYDVYNVPSAYRDRYYDTPEANYRYSDGYVYRIDPRTQLVAAAIELLL